MSVAFPNPQSPALEEGNSRLAKYWIDWLLSVQQSLGWSKGTSVYSDLSAGLSPDHAGLGAFTGSLKALDMGTGADTPMYFTSRLPNWFRNGTSITPYVDYCPADENAGNVLWTLGYSIAGDDEAYASETTEDVVQAVPEVALMKNRVPFAAISGTSMGKGDVIVGRVERVGTDPSDTYGAGVFPLAAGFKIQREGVGWETPHP